MNKRLTVWGITLMLVVACSALGVSSTALAAPNTNQKGSLLIFPRIDVSDGKQNIVVITNDSGAVWVHCYYMDKVKQKVDFEFPMSANDVYAFDVTKDHPFPSPGPQRGLLTCWAERQSTDPNQPYVPIVHNHLFGKVVQIDAAAGSAFEYNAWAVKALGAAGAVTSNPVYDPIADTYGVTLVLDGQTLNYEQCPRTLLGEYYSNTRLNGIMPTGPERTLLTVASCTLDLGKDQAFIATQLDYDIFDDKENKFTMAWECSDSWHETYLGEAYRPTVPPAGPAADQFPAVFACGGAASNQCQGNFANFNTATNSSLSGWGFFRVYTAADRVCTAYSYALGYDPKQSLAAPENQAAKINTQNLGLVGIQISGLKAPPVGDPNGVSITPGTRVTPLNMSGTRTGTIKYRANTGQSEAPSP